jgi:hypothetical protein
MPIALEIVTANVTAAVAAPAVSAMAAVAGDTLTVRNAAPGSKILMLTAWAKSQNSGILRIRSPQMADNVQGIRLQHVAAQLDPLLPIAPYQTLVSQDLLTLEMSENAVAGDIGIASYLVFYEDLVGVESRMAMAADISPRVRDIVAVENTITTVAGGGYTGAEAINAEFDLLRANTDYAILGYLVSAVCGSVRWRAIDFGNLGVGGPGHVAHRHITSRWFMDLSLQTGLPTVPVFNSANRAGVLIDVAQDENAAAVTVTTILAELSVG